MSLYLITPQINWTPFSWYSINPAHGASQHRNQLDNGRATYSYQSENKTQGISAFPISRNNWPTPGEMRKAAKRLGMPEWQSQVIVTLASVFESYIEYSTPIKSKIRLWWQTLKNVFKENLTAIVLTLFILMILALFCAFLLFAKEIKVLAWLLTHLDYLRLGIFAMHAPGNQGVIDYYKATERLFSLYDMKRAKVNSVQEYLYQTSTLRKDMKPQLSELTLLFEDSRYGYQTISPDNISRVRSLYRNIYQNMDI